MKTTNTPSADVKVTFSNIQRSRWEISADVKIVGMEGDDAFLNNEDLNLTIEAADRSVGIMDDQLTVNWAKGGNYTCSSTGQEACSDLEEIMNRENYKTLCELVYKAWEVENHNPELEKMIQEAEDIDIDGIILKSPTMSEADADAQLRAYMLKNGFTEEDLL